MLYSLIARDIVEIFFYSACIFSLCTWLRTDKTKNMIGYFFSYCTLALLAWFLQLPTLTPFLFYYAPIALLLFIILHEKTLQRNFVSLRVLTPARKEYSSHWLDAVLSSCLALINTHKKTTIIIENQDALDHIITAPFFINADLEKNMLDILFASTAYDEHKMVWITTAGKIRSFNNVWHMQDKKEDALFFTQQTDAIIIITEPVNRTFTLIMHGKETRNLSAHQVRTMIKKELSFTTARKHKGAYHEAHPDFQ